MLCEKCKNKSFDDSPSAKAQGFVMGLPGKKPRHDHGEKWFPGASRKDLEDWCAKNCKPATEKVKMVDSNKNWLKKDKKKD